MTRRHADAFPFEGGDTTADRLTERIPAYSAYMLQTALENGCQTVRAVMFFLARREYEKKQAMRRGSHKGGTAARKVLPGAFA